jgi:membrane associated rhomboid family serine protease
MHQRFSTTSFSRGFLKGQNTHSLGASGVLSSVITFTCLSITRRSFTFSGIDIPAPFAALVWAVQDAILLLSDDGIGHGTHLGGDLFGAMVYWTIMLLQTKSRKKFLMWTGDVCREDKCGRLRVLNLKR